MIRNVLRISLLSVAVTFSIGCWAQTIEPADVYVSTLMVHHELELIRQAMNRPRDERPEIDVHDAQPREVYFQAITLLLKSDRLCSEHSSAPGLRISPFHEFNVPAEIRPANVLKVVLHAADRVQCTKAGLELSSRATRPERDATKIPTDVFRSIVQANRQINLLLEEPFAPGEVYAAVSLATEHVEALLDATIPVWRVTPPSTVLREEGKIPSDVFAQLLKCFAIIEEIAQKSALAMLKLNAQPDSSIVPSDVFDLAALVLSEVRYFTSLLGNRVRFALKPDSGKIPSDVFWKAKTLEQRLSVFLQVTQMYPRWHRFERLN